MTKNRKPRVESENYRDYGRAITFNIPEGDAIKNLAVQKIDFCFREEGEGNLYFTTEYKI